MPLLRFVQPRKCGALRLRFQLHHGRCRYEDCGYAGFWVRVAATVIDGFVTTGIAVAVAMVWGGAGLLTDTGLEMATVGYYIAGGLASWLYYATCESSGKQATLGKRAVGIVVTDTSGQRLSFGRASGRAFAKWLNALTLGIGWIVVAFSKQKRGLHDFVAGTLVVQRTRESQSIDLPAVAGSVNKTKNSIATSPARNARPAMTIALCMGLLAAGGGAYIIATSLAAAEPPSPWPDGSATPVPASSHPAVRSPCSPHRYRPPQRLSSVRGL